MTRLLLLCLAPWLALASPGQTASLVEDAAGETPDEIHFRVKGLRKDEGALACGLFQKEGWLKNGSPAVDKDVVDGEAICVFRDVAPGRYGISAYHDENGNGELDSNWLRIPREGTAASNDARGKMGPPKFEDAGFDYRGGRLELEGKMHYR